MIKDRITIDDIEEELSTALTPEQIDKWWHTPVQLLRNRTPLEALGLYPIEYIYSLALQRKQR